MQFVNLITAIITQTIHTLKSCKSNIQKCKNINRQITEMYEYWVFPKQLLNNDTMSLAKLAKFLDFYQMRIHLQYVVTTT